MTSEIQERLLEEFKGLFDGKATEMNGLGDGGVEATQSVSDTLDQMSKTVAGVALEPMEAGGKGADSSLEANDGTAQPLTEAARSLEEMAASTAPAAAATTAGSNTRGGSSTAESGNSTAASIGSIATTFLESGLGIVPLVTSLIGLFSGGSDAPPALEKYVAPPSMSFESADGADGLTAADFDQTGAPRAYQSASSSSTPTVNGDSIEPAGPAAGGRAAPAQITVNVQAMDAQSFLDNSSQIAQAVRSAMLNLSALNDVVNDL